MEHTGEHSQFHNNAVYFIGVDKVFPNPFQPRKDFDEERLKELSDSIRMYGVLQPLVVTRKEVTKEDGGLATEYELIAGERRLRASKLAGLREVPALIRSTEDDDRVKLELAIIENLQREDLNPVDRARAFAQLANTFNFKHAEIGKKVGRSREYVSNTIRLLLLPEDMLNALSARKISEGHTRPLLMLCDRPEEQKTLFREIILKKMTVREAEKISRKIAYDKVRKKGRMFDPQIIEMEQQAEEMLGTRVHIEPGDKDGGRIRIDYFSDDDLRKILAFIRNGKREDRSQTDFEKKLKEPIQDIETIPASVVVASGISGDILADSVDSPDNILGNTFNSSNSEIVSGNVQDGVQDTQTFSSEVPYTENSSNDMSGSETILQDSQELSETEAPQNDFSITEAAKDSPVDDSGKEDEDDYYSLSNFSL